jgi:hypothetical protein
VQVAEERRTGAGDRDVEPTDRERVDLRVGLVEPRIPDFLRHGTLPGVVDHRRGEVDA